MVFTFRKAKPRPALRLKWKKTRLQLSKEKQLLSVGDWVTVMNHDSALAREIMQKPLSGREGNLHYSSIEGIEELVTFIVKRGPVSGRG